jgi:hypothetical protein
MDYINTSSHYRVGGNAKIQVAHNELPKKVSLVDIHIEASTQEIN